MKRILIFFLAVIALAQCRKAEVLEFPLIQTGEVSDISENGATFTAKIINLGALQVESYGFLWGLKANPDLESSNLSLSGNVEKGVFSANITNDLLSDTTYFVRAFITDGNNTTYGKTVSFRSRGSMVPVISDFHPKSGVENTVVVIKGDHFSASLHGNTVHIGDFLAKVEKASKTELEVVLPGEINISGYVDIQVETAKQYSKSTEKFLLEGCLITGFHPLEAKANEVIKIYYENCGSEFDIQQFAGVKIGTYPAQILAVHADTILAKINFNVLSGKQQISLWRNGKTTLSLDSILIVSPWSKLSVTPPLIRRNLSGFQIGNDLYVGLGANKNGSHFVANKDFYRYMPEQQQWIAIADIPSPEREYSPSFALNGKGYICLGINADQTMLNRYTYAYDPQSGNWLKKADFPLATRNNAIGFAIGNYGYAGLGYEKRDLWQYDPQANTWSIKDNYPNYFTEGVFGVTHGNLAYVGLGRKSTYSNDYDLDIFTFNPQAVGNNWSFLTTFPGEDRYLATAFVINNYLYVGLGERGVIIYTDFWRYDLDNDVWERLPDLPFTPRLKPQVFVVDGKAVLVSGFGWEMSEDETILIYDPN